MRFGILHLSDLHRDLKNEIENDVLLESLQADFGRFASQDPPIPLPDLCVVSGDLVYGCDGQSNDPDAEIRRQYAQAVDLLVHLADRFFQGRRDHVVLIPGNHDVSYPDVQNSLTRIDIPAAPNEKDLLVRELSADNSLLRWSWRDLCFYRISDTDRYSGRLRFFADAYQAFYQGMRKYPMNPAEQWDIFDFDDVGLCIMALNSCYRNDPLRRTACFHPSAVARACAAARTLAKTGRLLGAVWHHSLLGTPSQDDYLDAEILQNLIDSGVSFGLHGHQHRPAVIQERFRVGSSGRKISVISAGTLCSAPRALPTAIPRSYNMIAVDTDDWQIRINQRVMVNGSFELPIWGPGRFLESDRSFIDLSISRPIASRPPQLDEQLALERAEALLGSHEWEGVLNALPELANSETARLFRMTALTKLGDHARTVSILWPPQTLAEVVTLGGALLEVGSTDQIKQYLELDVVAGSSDASVRNIVQRMGRSAL